MEREKGSGESSLPTVPTKVPGMGVKLSWTPQTRPGSRQMPLNVMWSGRISQPNPSPIPDPILPLEDITCWLF